MSTLTPAIGSQQVSSRELVRSERFCWADLWSQPLRHASVIIQNTATRFKKCLIALDYDLLAPEIMVW